MNAVRRDRVSLAVSGSRARMHTEREGAFNPKPPWLKVTAKTTKNYFELKSLMREHGLHTVCEESGPCPNIYECWEARTATFLILGNVCTRRCTYCDVITGKPGYIDYEEPERVAKAVAAVGLRYAVVTGVARDDIREDGGASIWAETIRAIRRANPTCGVEVLTPDFRGDRNALEIVMDAKPDVFAHNLETTRRMHPIIRKGFNYDRSVQVLTIAKEVGTNQVTKSGVIVGMGETDPEVIASIDDMAEAGVDLVTIGQYLSPSRRHPVVERYVHPDVFASYKQYAQSLGCFAHIESGPLVRSSYHALEQESAGRSTHAGGTAS